MLPGAKTEIITSLPRCSLLQSAGICNKGNGFVLNWATLPGCCCFCCHQKLCVDGLNEPPHSANMAYIPLIPQEQIKERKKQTGLVTHKHNQECRHAWLDGWMADKTATATFTVGRPSQGYAHSVCWSYTFSMYMVFSSFSSFGKNYAHFCFFYFCLLSRMVTFFLFDDLHKKKKCSGSVQS